MAKDLIDQLEALGTLTQGLFGYLGGYVRKGDFEQLFEEQPHERVPA